MSQELTQAVNKQVANWMVLYVKLHHYHWYVKGHHFFTLHEKFEELYDEANEHIDELAERILSIGGSPVSTLKECLEISSLTEAKGNETEEEMVRETISDFQTIIGECQTAMDLAEKEDDQGTSDMLLSIVSGLQKHVWMLQAYIG
ncbi:Dps family protein [Niallia sp. Krafla_26]|uniref:Dps family protein n=1 Tax=Niallia sp. Krafla_26 TaxID=3064703 RepID=UPI003D182314